MPISDESIRMIIVDGNAQETVTQARSLGRALKNGGLSTAQLRGVFGTVRSIEIQWRKTGIRADKVEEVRRQAWRQLVLLKPKLAYRARRHTGMRELAVVLSKAIDLVDGDRAKFQNLVEFLEAILAYHVEAGGKTS